MFTLSFEELDTITGTKNSKAIFDILVSSLEKNKDYTMGRGAHIEVALSGFVSMSKMMPSLSIEQTRVVTEMYINGAREEGIASVNSDVIKYSDIEDAVESFNNAYKNLIGSIKGGEDKAEKKPVPMVKAFPTTKEAKPEDYLDDEQRRWIADYNDRINAIYKRDKIARRGKYGVIEKIITDYLYSYHGIHLQILSDDFCKEYFDGEYHMVDFRILMATKNEYRNVADSTLKVIETSEWYQKSKVYEAAKKRGKVGA